MKRSEGEGRWWKVAEEGNVSEGVAEIKSVPHPRRSSKRHLFFLLLFLLLLLFFFHFYFSSSSPCRALDSEISSPPSLPPFFQLEQPTLPPPHSLSLSLPFSFPSSYQRLGAPFHTQGNIRTHVFTYTRIKLHVPVASVRA